MASKLNDVTVKLGRLIRVWNTERKAFSNAKTYYIAVHVEDHNGDNEECLLFTEKEIERARYRASKNPEDVTKKGWWTDLND